MKVLKTIPETVKEKTVVDKVLCDVCENEIKNKGFDQSEVTIEGVIGEHYPECDTRSLYILDICPSCFMRKVIPVIENSLNVRFRVIRNDERYEEFE